MINRGTEKAVVVDTFRSRLSKMRFRIYEWAGVMAMLKKEVPTRMVMITLTYKKSGDYKSGNIHDFIKNLKRKVEKNLYGFAWVAELQKRGAVHYHLVMVVKKDLGFLCLINRGCGNLGVQKLRLQRLRFIC